ncbi:MAG: hypothetical protein AAGJ70_01685 [Pseudomonadota bacterium]
MPQPSVTVSDKIALLIARSPLNNAAFVSDFAAFANVRESVAHSWLDGTRTPYKKNIQKLADFWARYFPGLNSAAFLLEFDDFAHHLETAEPSLDGLVVPVDAARLTNDQIKAYTGTFTLHRFAATQNPSIVRESMSISLAPRRNEPELEVRLLSPFGSGVQHFVGTVALRGERAFIILSCDDPGASAMRFITLQDRLDGRRVPLVVGTLSGTFGRDEIPLNTRVTIERTSDTPVKAPKELALPDYLDPSEADKSVLIALSTTSTFGTTQYNNSVALNGTGRQTE